MTLVERRERFSVSDLLAPTTPDNSSSRQLKFGVDRILSDAFAPKVSIGCDNTSYNLHPFLLSSGGLTTLCSAVASYNSTYSQVPRFVPPSYSVAFPVVSTRVCVEQQVSDGGKRKRSWSRAVFSNLQRKGLEKRFLIQKYITKPDRRQLAATLGLTDAQVKVWFQNRRMKWRHSKEGREELNHHNNAPIGGEHKAMTINRPPECDSTIGLKT